MTGRSRVLIVSLALFALAIGVVIGSGPLRALLGEGSVDGSELEVAVAAAEEAQREASLGHDFADAVGPLVVAGRLSGRTVAIVRTAETTDEERTAATQRIPEAGAATGAEVALTADWTAEDRAPFRDALAEQITAALSDPPQGATTDAVLSAALAEALAPEVEDGAGFVSPEAQERADTLWTLLSEAGLVTGTRTANSDMFVLVTSGGDAAELGEAFATAGSGTVVAFSSDDATAVGGASTVTNATSYYGAWAVVGAAINAAGSITGAYDAADAGQLLVGPAS